MAPMNNRLLVPRASFDPRRLAGLEGWWDAADASSLTLDSGRVATWADKSGKSRNAVNSTSGSTQPDYVIAAKNGRNVVRFASASSQFLQAGSVGDWNFLHDGTKASVFVVARCFDAADPAVLGVIVDTGSVSSAQVGLGIYFDDRPVSRNDALVISGVRGSAGNLTVSSVQNNVLTPNTYVLIETNLDLGNATANLRALSRVNGGSQSGSNIFTNAPSTANSSYTLAFARGQSATPEAYFTGDICEVLMYSQHPTTAAQTAIRQYLAAKWGITLA